MRRDELVLRSRVERRALYLGEGDRALFAWLHQDPAVPAKGRVAVICPPLGHEYTRAHRTLRHLADELARAGVPALRFDYHGTGDSPGSDLDPGRLARWREDVRLAIERAQALSGAAETCLVGVRLGATLAALVATEMEVARLVLWNPCIKGRRYVRELQAIAQSAAQVASDAAGDMECAGFVLSAETLASVRALDLLQQRYRVRDHVLVVGRDDLSPDLSLNEALDAQGIANDHIRVPGWNGMMAEHQFTVVPEAALEAIVGWVARDGGRGTSIAHAPHPPSRIPRVSFPDSQATVCEEACSFGSENRLFGILSRRRADPDAPAVVMFNAGAVHHVGPNRIYVTLARRLAAQGLACLRFDLEGLGDSVAGGDAPENHPYPATATRDARAALEYLREVHGYSRFVLLGLCSGAHTAFHAALEIEDLAIEEVVLVNPLTYRWREGMSLETVNHFADAQAYRRSMRDPARWRKLLRGEVDMRRLLQVALAHPREMARSRAAALAERFWPARAPELARDLRRLFALGRNPALFVAEGDPGRDILLAGARYTAGRALREGRIALETIPGGDHTFSQSGPRREVLDRIARRLARGAAAPGND